MPQTEPTASAEQQRPPLPDQDFHHAQDPAELLQPHIPEPPSDRSDPVAVGRFVAALWGNRNHGDPPWHLGNRDWLTDRLSAHLSDTGPAPGAAGQTVRSLVVDATVEAGPTPVVHVTLEQARAVGGVTKPGFTIVVVELVLVAQGGFWLVGSIDPR